MSLTHIILSAREVNASCTIDTCDLSTSYFYYVPSLAANGIFAGIFGASLIGYLVVYGLTRRSTAFTVAMCCGTILEILGYIGRIMSGKNPWNENGFLLQIVCLTIAPAFLAAGIYLCLRRIVYVFGTENSRIAPESYTRIFIPCDLLSLILQAIGGAMASSASHSNKSPKSGNDIMIAGLAFQVFTLLIFMILASDFALRTYRRYKQMGEAAFDQTPAMVKMRQSKMFRGFLGALTLATITIFWRSVYRVAELSEGWTGQLIRKQGQFIGFEGVMVAVAVIVLNIFHPSYCFSAAMEFGMGGVNSKKRSKKLAEQRKIADEKAMDGQSSESNTDTPPV